MKITFLGTATSTGVPVVACDCPVCTSENPKDKRLRTSILISIGEKNFVIDSGPDFRAQMLNNNVADIEAIIYTHKHRDHIAGLDDVRAFNYVLNKRISVYGNSDVIEGLKIEFPYIFKPSNFFGAPQVDAHTISNSPFTVSGIEFIPIELMHGKMKVFGYRVGNFTYITDASSISDIELEKVKGSEYFVINALRNSRHLSHFSLEEALEIIKKVNPKRAFITHVSHFIGKHDDVNMKLPDNVELAWDGLVVDV